jgi:hypothetical protein
MAYAKVSYDAVVFSSGISSLLYALHCSNKDMDVLLVDRMTEYQIEENDIRLYPYELPIFGITNSEYAEDFKAKIGAKNLKNIFSELETPLTVVFSDSRFEYFGPYIKDEIKREFPDCQQNFSSFIDDILEIEDKLIFLRTHGWANKLKFVLKDPLLAARLINSDINFLYDRHDLPLKVRSILDAIIFVFSGVQSRNFPAIEAVRILSSVLSGVAVPKDGIYSLRTGILDSISKNIDVENYTGDIDIKRRSGRSNIKFTTGKNTISTRHVISDQDHMKDVFVKKFQEVKSTYSEQILYPYSIYLKMSADSVPGCINRWLLLIDADRSSLLNYEDIYAVRIFMEGAYAVMRVTSFLPYGYFDVDDSTHKVKASRMYETLKKIMPNIDNLNIDIFPDFTSEKFASQLYQSLANIEQGDIVYTNIPLKIRKNEKQRRMIYCGREERPYLGFEGIMNNSLRELK